MHKFSSIMSINKYLQVLADVDFYMYRVLGLKSLLLQTLSYCFVQPGFESPFCSYVYLPN